MLLKIYLGGTVFSWVTLYAGAKAVEARLEREGYHQVEKPETQAERIFGDLKVTTFMLIPVINFIVALVAIFKYDELYEQFKKNGIEDGTIYKVSSDTEDSSQVEISLDLGKNMVMEKDIDMSMEDMITWLRQEKEKMTSNQQGDDKSKVRGKYPRG